MSDIDDELFALAGGEDDGEIEEGEASSVAASSPNSLGSDAMEESDSDGEDDGPTKESDVPYPLEGKYIDSRDKNHIQSLPQLERERILGERAEEQTRAKFQAELARRANAKSLDRGMSPRKRKAESVDPDDSDHRSSRPKLKGKPNEKLERYKRERENRVQERQRHDDRRSGRRRSSSVDSRRRHSDHDAEGESDVDYPDYDKYDKTPRQEEPAELRHFEAVRVGRGYFSKVCYHPHFEEAMVGTFVRVGTGQDAQHRTLYKMAQIKGFTKGKPYVFEGKDNERLTTDQYVLAQHGTVKKEYTFSYLSNQRFTESDLDTYKQSLPEGSKLPSQTQLKKKYEDIKGLENHVWSDADIDASIRKKKQYAYLLASRSSGTQGPKPLTQSEVKAKHLADLNLKNRMQDSDRVRKALIEERRYAIQQRKKFEKEQREKKAAEEAQKKAEEEKAKAKAAKKANHDDLFDEDERAGTPRQGTPKVEKEKKRGLPTFRKPKMDDDIIASMDLGVDIDI